MKERLRRHELPSRRTGRLHPLSPAESSEPSATAFSPFAARIHGLVQEAETGSVAFQSVAVAALRRLYRVRYHEEQVAEAALSLAQQEKLHEMLASLTEVTRALQGTLSAQGTQMLSFCPDDLADEPVEHFWWFALTETIQVLEESIAWIASMVQGQPKGGATRTLSSVIARVLRNHHNTLLAEAEEWMS